MLSKFRCDSCDHYDDNSYGIRIEMYGKCKISTMYDGTIETKTGMWIDDLGCASHSSIRNIEGVPMEEE